MPRKIPIQDARRIAENYDYDQVIVLARKTGTDGMESVATYGRTKEHCDVAARIGDFLKFKVMGWDKEKTF